MLVLDMLENSFRNYRVGYAASEAVVLLVDRAGPDADPVQPVARERRPGMTMTPHPPTRDEPSATQPPPEGARWSTS